MTSIFDKYTFARLLGPFVISLKSTTYALNMFATDTNTASTVDFRNLCCPGANSHVCLLSIQNLTLAREFSSWMVKHLFQIAILRVQVALPCQIATSAGELTLNCRYQFSFVRRLPVVSLSIVPLRREYYAMRLFFVRQRYVGGYGWMTLILLQAGSELFNGNDAFRLYGSNVGVGRYHMANRVPLSELPSFPAVNYLCIRRCWSPIEID
nr:hypothetical protein CFP56_73118 [Quercus suber]